jgi:methionyl-tRNA formyltransferase
MNIWIRFAAGWFWQYAAKFSFIPPVGPGWVLAVKIILVGQGPFGETVLDTLIRRGEDVVGVFCPNDKRGEAIRALAERSAIFWLQPEHMKDPEVCLAYDELGPDLVILAFVIDIIPPALLEIPSLGTICYHPSLLPRHRGSSAINWAIILGETRTGLTILWVDEGIDSGPILLQRPVEIAPDDTAGSLYFSKLFTAGVDALVEAVTLIKSGHAPKLPQDESLATYEPPCNDLVASIDWTQPARKVYNLIRGCDPQPGAYASIQGDKVRFYQARLLDIEHSQAPGEILNIRAGQLAVALKGGAVGIGKVRNTAGVKMKAIEFAKSMELKAGMRFGT